MGFPGGTSSKEPACQCRRLFERLRFDPWVGKIPQRRAQKPTQVFLPGESHGQRSLAGFSPWGHEESDMAEAAQHTSTHSCFTVLSQFLPYSKVNQLYVYTYPFFFGFPSHLGHAERRVELPVLHSGFSLIIYLSTQYQQCIYVNPNLIGNDFLTNKLYQ